MNIMSESEITMIQERTADSSSELLEITQKVSELLEACSSFENPGDTDVTMMKMQFAFQKKRLQALESRLEEYKNILEGEDLLKDISVSAESILLSRQILLQNLLMIRQNTSLIDRISQDFSGFFRACDQQFRAELIACENKWKEQILMIQKQ